MCVCTMYACLYVHIVIDSLACIMFPSPPLFHIQPPGSLPAAGPRHHMVVPRQRILARRYQRLALCIYHVCTLLVAAVVTVTYSLLYAVVNARVGTSEGDTGSTCSSWTAATSRCIIVAWHSLIELAGHVAGSFGPQSS